MIRVRFKTSAIDYDTRMSYELWHDEKVNGFDDVRNKYCLCYNTKLLGLVDCELMEESNDVNDVPAINVFIELSKK